MGARQGHLEQRPGDSEDRSADRTHLRAQPAAPPEGEGHPQYSDLEPGHSHGQDGESLQDLPRGSQGFHVPWRQGTQHPYPGHREFVWIRFHGPCEEARGTVGGTFCGFHCKRLLTTGEKEREERGLMISNNNNIIYLFFVCGGFWCEKCVFCTPLCGANGKYFCKKSNSQFLP